MRQPHAVELARCTYRQHRACGGCDVAAVAFLLLLWHAAVTGRRFRL